MKEHFFQRVAVKVQFFGFLPDKGFAQQHFYSLT